MSGLTENEGPIDAVREGMRVVDADGDDVGTVAEVHLADPGSVTAQGQGTGRGDGLIGVFAEAFGGGDGLPEQEQERLARLGFVRIDAKGLFASDRYAASDEIAGVEADAVRLRVAKDRLVG